MNKFFAACLACLVTLFSTTVLAQSYPSKPIKLIVPFPPGGGTDFFARTIAQKLQETQKWTVIVENRSGAGGNVGVDAAAKAPADGYTIVLGQTSNLAVNPSLYPKLPYDPIKDLTPIVLVASSPVIIVSASDSTLTSFNEVMAKSKANPSGLIMGSPGNGTVAHLSSELLQKEANIRFQHVPYRGSAAAINDLIGGSINLFMASIPTALGQINSGKLRALAVTSEKRSGILPNVPTLAELGLKNFETITWFGFLAPSGTPADLIKTLNTEINKVLSMPDVQAKLKSEGGEVLGGTQEQFAKLLRSEITRWAKVVRESGAKLD
jgi:tripartite-type tricarboxylate transporter receptor subunit TctC